MGACNRKIFFLLNTIIYLRSFSWIFACHTPKRFELIGFTCLLSTKNTHSHTHFKGRRRANVFMVKNYGLDVSLLRFVNIDRLRRVFFLPYFFILSADFSYSIFSYCLPLTFCWNKRRTQIMSCSTSTLASYHHPLLTVCPCSEVFIVLTCSSGVFVYV